MNPEEKKSYLIRKYDVEYEVKTRILTINKPIAVKDFVLLKALLRNWKVQEYRVSVLNSNYGRVV